MKLNREKIKQLFELTGILLLFVIVVALLIFGNKLLVLWQNKSTNPSQVLPYEPAASLIIKSVETEPGIATAVPVLMYHGIVASNKDVGDNTSRTNFIQQLEMLYKNGYQTITVRDYDNYRSGTFILPKKPIIITFDDGRKDSFYPADEVLRKLNFKATIFIATIKANENDPFYLSWDELKKMKETGRWEIEAHGRHSHDTVRVDAEKTPGRFLTSRSFDLVNGLESVADFESRVKQDYENGITDLREQLDIEAQYFAIPLNDYGREESNYDGAYIYNKLLTQEYFKLAFIQCLSDENNVLDTFYNYSDTDPYAIRRLEIKNMTAVDLSSALGQFAPSKPQAIFPARDTANQQTIVSQLNKEFGSYQVTNEEILLQTNAKETATRVLVGDKGWKDYSFDVVVAKRFGKEIWVLIYYNDEDNYIQLYLNESTIGLLEKFNGVETVISKKSISAESKSDLVISLAIINGLLKAKVNELELTKNYQIKLSRGSAGFGLWDPEGGEVRISNLVLKSLE